jgi:glycosyltransferase involved in cell wall biosynthesis
VPRALQALDIFVLPSLNEGISNTILEAMACGMPALVTPVGGNVELVPNGEAGSYFAPGDAGALADLLQRYLREPALRQAHARAARARVVQHHALPAMVAAYRGVYDELLGR